MIVCSAMQLSCKSPSLWFATSSQLQLFCVLGMLVVCTLVSSVVSSGCPSCNPSECEQLDCKYGTYLDICGCCDVCARGPGELCGGISNLYGFCGTGLECVRTEEEGLPPSQLEQLPGTCTVIPSTTVPTTTVPVTSSSLHTTTHTPTTQPIPTPVPPESTPAPLCRKECSVTHCDGKNRVCSAKGLEFAPSSSRNSCQHTSCHACVLLVGPPSCGSIACGEPPSKTCMRTYYKCIEAHYSSSSFQVLALHDPVASLAMERGRGKIVCHVVDLLTTATN